MPSKADPMKCTGCGTCAEKCPEGAITMNDDGQPVVNEVLCIECGVCVVVCPSQARDITSAIGIIT